jgi:hypothetical protein
MKTLDSLFHLRKHLRIKNHTPGFLKLKIGMSMLKDPAFADLPDFDEKPRGVNKVKLSLFSRTVSLDYDPDIIPPGLLEELVATDDADRSRAIMADLEQRIGEPLL